jgi:hypothetical protein
LVLANSGLLKAAALWGIAITLAWAICAAVCSVGLSPSTPTTGAAAAGALAIFAFRPAFSVVKVDTLPFAVDRSLVKRVTSSFAVHPQWIRA